MSTKFSVTMLLKLNVSKVLVLLLWLRTCLARDKNVLKMTDSNFHKQITFHKDIMVMFFIPWSGLCQRIRPQYAAAADILKERNLPVAFGKIDCSRAGRSTCASKNLPTLPVLYFYHNGQFVKEYTGARDSLNIVKFMRVQVLPSPLELKNIDELKRFLNRQDDVVVAGFFEEDTRLKRMFFKVAEEMKESVIFVYSSCEKLLIKQGVMDGIVLFRPRCLHNKYEDERILFTGRTVIGEIKNFIIKGYHGLVGHRVPTNRYNFANPLVVVYYTVDYHKGGKEINYWRNRVIKVAHKYKNDVKFAISAVDDFEAEVADVTENISTMKPVVILRDLESKKYFMTEEFSNEALDAFVRDFLDQKLTPYIKSKTFLQHDNDGAVLIAHAQNFEHLVLNSTKDILLNLYAAWSGGSQKFALVLREVADLLRDDNVNVVKMDTTENEVPAMFAGKPLPNVYFLNKKKKKHPILYDGQPNVEQVIKFVAKMATNELNDFDRDGSYKLDKDEL